MFEKFNEIRHLSDESRVGKSGLNSRLLDASVADLSQEDLEELIQVCLFGRDFDPSDNENPADEFDRYRTVARQIIGIGNSVSYITTKPISKYIKLAEAKITGTHLELRPVES